MRAAATVLIGTAVHTQASGACSVGKIAELPVTMDRMGPMIDAKINGAPVRFIADSGAFFSVISPGTALSLRLRTGSGPFGFYIIGINGTASADVVTVKTFTLAGIDIPHVKFIVAGSETGGAGVIGQNILGMDDVEYDLPHGAIRLMKSQDCGKANLAYWATGKTYSMIPIDPRSPAKPHTIGKVGVNGKAVRATFDTGAAASILSLTAAARAGITPNSPGVTDGGAIWGFGRKLVHTWIAPVDTLTFGDGEQIQHARIRIGAMEADADMLVGADFFIAHRVYVDNKDHRLFLSYEGGPVFNLKARFDGPGATEGVGTIPETMAAPTVESYDRDGAIAMARDDLDTAIADFSKAIAMAPKEPRYLVQRSEAYFQRKQQALGRADLDRAIGLEPSEPDALLARAALKLDDGDKAGALADLDVADRAVDDAAMQRLSLGELFTDAGQPRRAIGDLDRWLKAHPDDVRRPSALNGRCWARALAGSELDVALHDCDAALRARPGTAAFLDSRGLVELRRGDFAKAVADYDDALAKQPKMAWSLYGRGVAKLRSGHPAEGHTDIAAAVAIRPRIVDDAKSYGVMP